MQSVGGVKAKYSSNFKEYFLFLAFRNHVASIEVYIKNLYICNLVALKHFESMKTFSKQSDKIGIISSSLCLVHCLSMPLLLSMQPLSSGLDAHAHGHLFELFFLVFSFVAVYFSTRHTASVPMKYAFYAVLSLFTLGFVFEESLYWVKYLGYLGSLGLIVLHLYNWKSNKQVCRHA